MPTFLDQSTLLCLSAILISAVALFIRFQRVLTKDAQLRKIGLLFMTQIVVLILLFQSFMKLVEPVYGTLPPDLKSVYDTFILLLVELLVSVPVTAFTLRLRPPEEEKRWWHDLLGMSPLLLAIVGLVAYVLWLVVIYLR